MRGARSGSVQVRGGYRYYTPGSLAGLPHLHAREIARRVRQGERNARRQLERLPAGQGELLAGSYWGLSRRGRLVPYGR